MENVTVTLTGKGMEEVRELRLQIVVAATVNVDAKTARRQVTSWLVSEVGNMLVGEMPQLVIGERTLWRVPVVLTSSVAGTVGEVDTMDVDAGSGELLVSEQIRERILNHVKTLAGSTLPPVA